MRQVEFDGVVHEFPDETTDEMVAQVLKKYTSAPSYSEVAASIPGEAKRQLAEAVSGAVTLGADLGILGEDQRTAAEGARKEIASERQAETPRNMSLVQEGLQAGGTSLITQGPAMAVAALAAPVAAPIALAGGVTTAMGAMTGLQKYGETRDAGFGPTRSSLHALFHGLVEKYTEYLPLKDLVGKPITSAIYSFLGKEMAGEQLATLLQDLNDKISTKPDMTLGDYLHDAAVTAIATAASAPVQAGVVRATSAAMAPFIKEDKVTPEQKIILDEALKVATSDGSLPVMPPVAPVGSVEAPPVAAPGIDLGDLAMPDKTKPLEEGQQRVYALVPTDGEIPEHTVWTPDLSKLQPIIAMKPNFRVAYLDMPQEELTKSQKGETIEKFRQENQVGDDEYALPTSFASQYIYNPAPAASSAPVVTSSSLVGAGGSPSTTTSPGANASTVAPATKPVEHAIIYRNEESKTKIRIRFADEGSKLLYLFAKHLASGATYATQQQIVEERETLKKIYSTDDTGVEAMAKHYFGSVNGVAGALKQNGTMRPEAFSPATYQANMDSVGSPENQRYDQLSKGNTSPGEVLIAPDVETTPHVRKMQAFLQKWLTMFAPGTKLMITGVGAGAMPAMITRMNGVGMIRIPSESSTAFWSIFSLAHEFGHHILHNVMERDEYAHAVAELQLEHQALVARVNDMTVEEFIDEWMAPNKMAYKRHVYEKLGVQPTDPALLLVKNIDAQRSEGYTLSFDEYAAEQFARYVGKNRQLAFSASVREWFEQAIKEVRAFFTQIVAKISPQKNFEKFVNTLITFPIEEQVYTAEKMDLLAQDSWFDSVDELNDVTTRVIQRLPKKDKIQRITIVGELSRQDVKDQERTLLQSVLDTFDGDVIDRQEFTQRVMEKLVPISTTMVSKYATYGLERIGVRATGEPAEARSAQTGNSTSHFHRSILARTELFRLPFEISKANHFSDPNYLGHARYFDDKGVRSVVELQSDLAQKDNKNVTKEGLEQKIEEAKGAVELWNTVGNTILEVLKDPYMPSWTNKSVPDTAQHYYNYTVKLSEALGFNRIQNELVPNGLVKMSSRHNNLINWISPELHTTVIASLNKMLEENELRKVEAASALQNLIERRDTGVIGRIESLPKRWWEFMLRKMHQEAARAGITKMRLGTADTIAKVEGWPKVPTKEVFVEKLKGKEIAWSSADGDDGPYLATGKITNINARPERDGFEPAIEYTNRKGERFVTDWGTFADENPDMTDLIAQSVTFTYGRAQGIYNRYANEITKFVKREFGAKEIATSTSITNPTEYLRQNPGVQASPGTLETWLEWDIKTQAKDVPIEYYDLLDSMQQASDNVGSATKEIAGEEIPQVGKYFEKFTSFMLNSLQLNQLAKILPHVQPLQTYRRLMQNMANLKNQLMDGPNSRIKEWYSLSKSDSIGVQDMLRMEVAEGKHWTRLEKTPITVGGKQLEMWIHLPSERVEAEAKKRGLSLKAVQMFIAIKNDFTTTLGTMEQTILNSIEEFFRKNPIAGATRQAVVRAQFTKFREQPFIPDKRIGQWSVVIRAKDSMTHNGVEVKRGEIVYFSGHQRRFQQKREFASLKKQYGGEFTVTMEYVEDLPYVMRSLPREFIRSLPEQLQLTPDQMARYEELYYDITKEGKYLQLLGMGKKKIAGAPEDLRQAYSNYMWRTANLISKMAYSRKLQRETYELNRVTNIAAKSGGDVTALRRLHEYMVKNFDYVMRPQHEWEQLRAFVSLWYLWGVPKTALMNTTTLVTTTYPRLAAQAGDVKATAHILRAIKDVAQFWRDPAKISQEVAALFAQARADGVTNQSFAAELAAVADGNAIERIMPQYAFLRDSGVKDTVRKATWKMIHWGMLPFRVMEEMNRRVTLLAAYRIERSLGKPALAESVGSGSAYLAARDTVDYTQNEYAPWNRANFLRGKKSVALIFYSFVQNMSFFLMGGDKGWWRGWLIIAALAGLEGLPGSENVIDFLNWLSRKVLGEPVDLRLEAREMATAIGVSPDYVMHGAMHSMFGLGWDTASSVGLGRIIPGTDAIFGQGDANQRIVQMAGEVGGPFVSLTTNVLQALFDDNPNTLLRFDRAVPPIVRNLERAYRGATENQWTDSRGRALVDEATGLEVLGQALGFSPTTKTTHQEELHTAKEAAQFYVLRRTNLMSSLFQATLAKDYDAIADAKDAIREYNSTVPAPQLRITGQEIQQSLQARRKAAAEVESGRPSVKKYQSLYERVGDAFAQ